MDSVPAERGSSEGPRIPVTPAGDLTTSLNRTRGAWPQGVYPALVGWRIARENARRQNRNLLQYAASLAAVLGLGSATGGILSVADSLHASLKQIPTSGPSPLEVAGVIVLIWFSLVLLALLVWSFYARRRAEEEADHYFAQLLASYPEPERFLDLDVE